MARNVSVSGAPREGVEVVVGDADLLVRLAARDAGALEELFSRYATAAYALARRVLNDDGLAEDVVQDVFLALWRDPSRYDPARGAFASWLLSVTHHRAVDAVRREESLRRRGNRAAEDAVPSRVVDAHSAPVVDQVTLTLRKDLVLNALGQLPTAQRQALALAYFGGYTQREVAAMTGAPLGTVKTRTLAGMRRLRSLLERSDAGEAGR